MTNQESSDSAPASRSVLAALFFAGLFLLVVEVIWTFATGLYQNVHVSPPFYLASLAAITTAVWLLHVLPAWGLYELGRRFVSRGELVLIGGAAMLGVLAQNTLIQGDGIGAHPLFGAIRVGFLIVFPLVFAAFTWLVVSPRFSKIQRLVTAAVGLVAGLAFNLFVLVEYQAFHGYLAAYNAALVLVLTRPVWERPKFWKSAAAMAVIVAVAAIVAIPQQDTARTHVQRFSHLPASLSAGLPLGEVLRVEPEDIFAFDKATSEELQEYYETFFGDESKFEEGEPRGENVLLIVLESVRADYWDDPELTPEFHQWKQQGTYFPRAVGQYPATPLAYGAMFAGQPPSVVAQTPAWGQNRLFDGIDDRFDHVFLSRPDISWFEHTAITDFFVPRDHPVNAHDTGPDGLSYLREEISSVDEGENFFSWVHLYEPHSPYEAREPWVEGRDDRRSSYRSEIAYTDKHLGEFMDWFFDQPAAEDTLVVLIADHGQAMGEEIMGESFWGHHVHVQNVISHIPMFVAGPGLPQDSRKDDLGVMQLDVMPTIYDFTGAALPEAFMPQGNSVYYLLENRPERPLVTEAFSIRGGPFFDFVANTQQSDEDLRELRREFHRISTRGQRYSPKIGIQQGDYKLIYDRLLQRSWLYNIAEDPGEEYDLYTEKPEVAEKMKERLQYWNLLQGEVVRRLDEL